MTEKEELLKLKMILEFIKHYINQYCVYDEHLQGYLFDLTKGQVRTLMYEINRLEKGECYDSGEAFNNKRSQK
jgi:hypothetical protein